ncbi:hypothetical protein [Streptomyces cylindrosporus]|uniref:Uncharacterized protein n=1 Tax=Streptomyces cylindrosporus TaxID=2927583 RepID=A0ABS9YM66_9ACTN|nr:hypothetical protein [Streptomyces cylindrosporus]MCI3277645.1 hypothetical protein [Streptomyces cylindrosporus]
MTNRTGNLAAPTDERRCTAHKKGPNGEKGERCQAWALKGQTVCRVHGGKAPQNLAAARRRQTEERALELVETYGRPVDTTPSDALLDEVKWTAGHVAWLRQRVQEIEAQDAEAGRTDPDADEDEEQTSGPGSERPHPLVWGVTRRKTGGDDWGRTEEAAPNIWLRLYQQERAHLVKVCEAAIRAGIEERKVRVAEQQGALVAQVIRAILADLRLTKEQQARVPEVVPRHLRALAS